VDPARLRSVGMGEANPVASNETAEGRQLNRRVMLIRTDSGN
jgi:outer membrane protein OmpA-like peptidoglycan-associated protein